MSIRDNVQYEIAYLIDGYEDGNASEFARKVGVSRSRAHNWLSGTCSPTLDMAMRYVHSSDGALRRGVELFDAGKY